MQNHAVMAMGDICIVMTFKPLDDPIWNTFAFLKHKVEDLRNKKTLKYL